MFAQLGSIQFNTIKTFGEFSERASANYAEHVLIDDKPRLQRTGSSLNEISISIYFHASFCNPNEEFRSLKEARDNGEVLPLLWGNGELEGDFVIASIDATIEEAAPDGTLLGISVQMSLKEYVMDNKLQQMQNDSRNNAKAVGDKKPVTNKKGNISNCAQTISKIVNKVYNHFSQINDLVQTGTSATPVGRTKILSNLNASKELTESLLSRFGDSVKCNDVDIMAIKSTAQQHLNSIGNFNESAENNQPANYSNSNAFLGSTARKLKQAAQELISHDITRK